jgi:hypothetical protein
MYIKPTDLLSASIGQHLALLYEDENRRNDAEVQCIIKALAQGQFCIYASVAMHDANSMASFASNIPGYDNFVRQGDLLVIDFEPFYDDALEGSLGIFEQLRASIEDELEKRAQAQKSKKRSLSQTLHAT